MKIRHTALAIVAVSTVAFASPNGAAVAQDQTLTVAESTDSFRLSVPVSGLVMTIPKGGLVVNNDPRSGSSDSPRYFNLEDGTGGIIISGWFEPAASYQGVEKFWKEETGSWQGPKPKHVSFLKVDNWDAILYDTDLPKGLEKIRNTHIRSEWVELGTWIDVHISVTTTQPIDVARATAMAILKGIRVTAAQ